MYLYCIFYFFTKMDVVRFTPALMYFGYTFILCAGFFLMTGTIGFYACFVFVRKIYASVKVD